MASSWARREFLRIGGLGTLGLTLPELLRAGPAPAPRRQDNPHGSFGKAKACILLFMFGGPSQQETFDPKPHAPDGIRGEFRPIATSVPGVRISEHFPLLAQRAHRYTIVRSVSHTDNFHSSSCHYALTGHPYPRRAANLLEARPDDFPNVGSAVVRLRGESNLLPPFVWLLSTFQSVASTIPGQGAGFLGKRYDPLVVLHDPNAADFRVPALSLPTDISLERLAGRRGLLDAVNRRTEAWLHSGAAAGMDPHFEKALRLVRAPLAGRAFNLAAEPCTVRDRYGRNTFGQAVLLARRLVQHGVRFVTARWYLDQTDIQVDEPAWDTHIEGFPRLKNRLMPPADRAFSSLLDDLADRGMLEETLVVWLGEFGRTPRINRAGGRDHWASCTSVVLAGGGIRNGQVWGASDRNGGYPVDKLVTPADLIATIYHCLGIGPDSELPDHTGRPVRIAGGVPILGLFC
jgi:hypothetical protein